MYGFFPAATDGEDIVVYTDDDREGRAMPASLSSAAVGTEGAEATFRSLADYIAPHDSGRKDYVGGFCVTTGVGCDELAAAFDADHDDYNSILVKAVADRLAEAFAECLHARVRREWGYGRDEGLSNEDLIKERYRGIRPAPGYPAQPDHTEKRTLFDLLGVEEAIGVTLTESYAMHPRGERKRVVLRPPGGALLRRRPPES